jgi:hypothetical protein
LLGITVGIWIGEPARLGFCIVVVPAVVPAGACAAEVLGDVALGDVALGFCKGDVTPGLCSGAAGVGVAGNGVCRIGAAVVGLGVGGGAAEGTCALAAPADSIPATAIAIIPRLCREDIAYLLALRTMICGGGDSHSNATCPRPVRGSTKMGRWRCSDDGRPGSVVIVWFVLQASRGWRRGCVVDAAKLFAAAA